MRSALRDPRSTLRSGFTLVEMLVTIGILLLLMTITLATVNISMDSDRIASGARSMQSFLEGARNRAMFAGRPRGVRLAVDPNNPSIATSILYIEAPEPWPPKNLSARDPGSVDPAGKVIVTDGSPDTISGPATSTWLNFYSRGLLPASGPIRVMIGTAPDFRLYTVRYTGTTWELTREYHDSNAFGQPVDSYIYTEPVVLPNQEPRTLASGIVIDLDQTTTPYPMSQLPSSVASTIGTGQPIDILFSPRGAVTGPLASAGTIHLRLADITDVNQSGTTAAELKRGRDEILVSIRTQTGKISTHPVNPMRNPAGDEIDPFLYAELGEGSGP